MKNLRDFLAGVLTGVAIGMLTAPRSGKDTRNKLVGAAEKQTEGLKGQWDKTVSQAKETFESVKSQAGLFADKAENKFDEIKDDATSAYQKEKARGQYNDKVDDAADAAKSGVNKLEDAFKVN